MTAAVRAGVPSVVVPFFFDQRFWGQTLQRRRLGPAPIPARRFSREALHAALAEIDATPHFARTLQRLGEQLAAEDGAATAAGILERAMEGMPEREWVG
jgi:sterol 3beta-glucosyltransferase